MWNITANDISDVIGVMIEEMERDNTITLL